MEGPESSTKINSGNRCFYYFWRFFIAYLILVVIVQTLCILRLHDQVVELRGEVEETHNNCNQLHSISKRYVSSLHCPPGCIRRRRRKGLFGVAGRIESTVQPYLYSGKHGPRDEQGWSTIQKSEGPQGAPGGRGEQGARGSAGEPGSAGQPGAPGGRGESGARGLPGAPGRQGMPGGMGKPGLRGPPGPQVLPGRPGEQGESGSPGSPGRPGARGPSGERGSSGDPGYSYNYNYGYNYNTGQESTLTPSPVVKSGHTRGDQGAPQFDPNFPLVPMNRKNETQMSEVLRELRLLDHPECKDDLDHQNLMDTFREKGRVSFMILVDLQDSVYCIVHGRSDTAESSY